MTVPILIVTGFLGAGKTTLINRLLAEAGGRRIAAVVNDFGAINIDADLIANRSDDVIGLENGCICCSLQGELLRTLKYILSRSEPVDHIVIEASGVADPQGILTAVLDPALHRAVQLGGVLAVVDAEDCLASPERQQDKLWQAQVGGADFIALAKTAGGDSVALLRALSDGGRRFVFDSAETPLPMDVVLDSSVEARVPGASPIIADDRFVRVEWRWTGACSQLGFQQLIGNWSPDLLRAKGILNLSEQPQSSMVFQLVGRRATMTALGRTEPETRLVLIGERGRLDPEVLRANLAALFGTPFPENADARL